MWFSAGIRAHWPDSRWKGAGVVVVVGGGSLTTRPLQWAIGKTASNAPQYAPSWPFKGDDGDFTHWGAQLFLRKPWSKETTIAVFAKGLQSIFMIERITQFPMLDIPDHVATPERN